MKVDAIFVAGKFESFGLKIVSLVGNLVMILMIPGLGLRKGFGEFKEGIWLSFVDLVIDIHLELQGQKPVLYGWESIG